MVSPKETKRIYCEPGLGVGMFEFAMAILLIWVALWGLSVVYLVLAAIFEDD